MVQTILGVRNAHGGVDNRESGVLQGTSSARTASDGVNSIGIQILRPSPPS